jgi:phospholipid transport system substrate-binding protein
VEETMKLFKFMWIAFVALALMTGVAQAEENPYELLQGVATKTFNIIKARQTEIQANPDILKEIVEKELVPYVDYRFAGAKVLGKHFKSIAKDRELMGAYFEEFRKYLIATYAVALSQYDDQEVLFEPAKDFDGKKDVTVRALIKDDDRPDIKISFKVRKSSRTNEWKAYDMVAEGISMLSSKSTEFESVLRQDGVEKVIEIMRSVNEKPMTLKNKES